MAATVLLRVEQSEFSYVDAARDAQTRTEKD
jgi:hypothetical protein